MLALVFDGGLRLETGRARPHPAGGEALIRVRKAGICNTDIEIMRGYKGYSGVLGHEFVGDVVEAGERSWIGQRVCGEINIGCGSCLLCLQGERSHCAERRVLGILAHDGAFAEYLTLPLANLHPVPPQVTDDEAVFVEPLAAAFEILEQVAIRCTDRVVVLGDGKLGNLCAQVLALTGSSLLVIGKYASKLRILQSLGIATATPEQPLPWPPDIVVEATGSTQGLERALDAVRPRGTVIMKSTVAGKSSLDLSPVAVDELRIVGSRCGPFSRAISALVHREVQVDPLISARMPLEEGVRALQCAQEPGVLKVMLDIPAG